MVTNGPDGSSFMPGAATLEPLECTCGTAQQARMRQPVCPNLRRVKRIRGFRPSLPENWRRRSRCSSSLKHTRRLQPGEWIRSPAAPYIPTDDGQLLTADQSVFAPEGTHVPDGRHPVARPLCEDAETKRILAEVMKVKPLDDSVWESVLREALSSIPSYPAEAGNAGWQIFG